MVTRNYITLIETERKEPSVRLLSQLESLAPNVDSGNVENAGAVYDPAPGSGGHLVPVEHRLPKSVGSPASTVREIEEHIARVIAAARADPHRLGWILEQLRSHLQPPPHWAKQDESAKLAHYTARAHKKLQDHLKGQKGAAHDPHRHAS